MIRRRLRQSGVRWCSGNASSPPPPPPSSSSSSSTWVTSKSKKWEEVEAERASTSATREAADSKGAKGQKAKVGLEGIMESEKTVEKLKGSRVNARNTFQDPWATVKPAAEANPKAAALERRGDVRKEIELPEAEPMTDEAVESELDDLTDDLQNSEDKLTEISGAYAKDSDWQFTITEDNFNIIEEDDTPWVLDCWAPQNEDNIAMSLTLRLLIKKVNTVAGKTLIKLGRMDCNLNYSLTLHLGINTLPTALAIKGDEILEQQTGMVDEEGMAQFIFGYASTIYGEEILCDLQETDPVCMIIDARIALKNKDTKTALMKYSEVYKTSMRAIEEEKKIRRANADKGIFEPEATREITDNEILAGKASAGLAISMYNLGKVRHAKKLIKELPDTLPKVYATMSDVRKAVSSVEIMRLTGYSLTDDIEELEDEERIDQHNLDIKLKLVGAYFMSADYVKALGATFILIRKNRRYRDGVAKIVLCRIMQYMGRHHPVRDEFEGAFNQLLQRPMTRTSFVNQKLALAINEGHPFANPLAHEVPLMIDRTPFRTEDNARHPLLR